MGKCHYEKHDVVPSVFRATVTNHIEERFVKDGKHLYKCEWVMLVGITENHTPVRDHIWVKRSKALSQFCDDCRIIFTAIQYSYTNAKGDENIGLRHLRKIGFDNGHIPSATKTKTNNMTPKILKRFNKVTAIDE